MKTILLLSTIIFFTSSISPITAQEWQRMNFLFANDIYYYEPTQEHLLEYINKSHNASKLFDGELYTQWVVSKSSPKKISELYVSIPENFRTINFVNKFTRDSKGFEEFSRAKTIRITPCIAINPMGHTSESSIVFLVKEMPLEKTFTINNVATRQTITNPFDLSKLKRYFEEYKQEFSLSFQEAIDISKQILRIEFVDVYEGARNELSLSQIYFNNAFIIDYREIEQKVIKSVYVDELNEGKLLVEQTCGTIEVVLDEPDSVLQILETSADNKWVSVIRMPAHDTGGRMETEYLLVNIQLGEIMNSELEDVVGYKIYEPFFLEENNGKTHLLLSDEKIELR